MILLIFVGTVVLPVVCWFLFIRSKDKSEPEPKRLVRRTLIVGVAAVFAAIVLEEIFYGMTGLPIDSVGNEMSVNGSFVLILLTVFLAGPIEELIKYIVLRYSVYFTHDFNQIFDGIVYGVTVALAFSFVENTFYFIGLSDTFTTPMLVGSALFRGLFTTLTHVTATGIIGYYLGKAKFTSTDRSRIIIKGIIYGSLVHGFFNVCMSSGSTLGVFLCIISLLTIFLLFVRVWNRPEVRMVWQYVPPPTDVTQ